MKFFLSFFFIKILFSLDGNPQPLLPIQIKTSMSYAPFLVVGNLLIDPDLKELYWDEKHGYIRDPKAHNVILSYEDTIRIGQKTFYVPKVANNPDIAEISYTLNLTIGEIGDQIYSGERGVGSDRIEKLFDVSPRPPEIFKQETRYLFHKNLSALFSRFICVLTYLPRKAIYTFISPEIKVYDNFTLIATNRRFEKCRIFVYPNSFFILGRGVGLVAFGHNTAKEDYYFILEHSRHIKGAAPSSTIPSWRRRR